MKELFKRPVMVEEAAKAQKGLNWILEILIFIAVFFVCNMAMVMLIMPVEFVMMFTDKNYLDAAKSGNQELIQEATAKIISGDVMTITMLVAEIAMIGIALLFCKLIQKRKMATVGFFKKDMFKEYLLGLVVGFAMFSFAVLIAVMTGAIKFNGISETCSIGLFLLYAFGFMIQGMAEEVLCRGYFMVSYARKHSVAAAIIANSLVFAALHLGNSGIDVLSFINLTLFGIFASVYFVRRGSLWGIGALHSIWNLVQGNFYGIRVSGMVLSNSILDSTIVEGKELFNGGAFGLEGSISVTIILVVATVIMYFTKEKKYDR